LFQHYLAVYTVTTTANKTRAVDSLNLF